MLNMVCRCILWGGRAALHRWSIERRVILMCTACTIRQMLLLHPRCTPKNHLGILLYNLLRKNTGLLVYARPLLARHTAILILTLHLHNVLVLLHGVVLVRCCHCAPLEESLQFLILVLIIILHTIGLRVPIPELLKFSLCLNGELFNQFSANVFLLLVHLVLVAEDGHSLIQLSIIKLIQALQILHQFVSDIHFLGALSWLTLLVAHLLITKLYLHGLAGFGRL